MNSDKYLGCIIGHILGDGSIDKKYLQPFFTNQNLELIFEFQNAIKYMFNMNPRIWIQTSDYYKGSKWRKRLYSIEECHEKGEKELIGLFYRTELGRTLNKSFDNFAIGKSKHIPRNAFGMSKEFKRALIRAFFDDEGSVYRHHHMIRVFQDRIEMLSDFKSLLKEFNIRSNPVRSYIKHNKERYYFSITGYDNLLTYQNRIGFTSTNKKEKLKGLVKQIGSSKTFRLPHGESRRIIIKILNECGKYSTSTIISELKKIHPKMKWDDSGVRKNLKILNHERKVKYNFTKGSYFWYIPHGNTCSTC